MTSRRIDRQLNYSNMIPFVTLRVRNPENAFITFMVQRIVKLTLSNDCTVSNTNIDTIEMPKICTHNLNDKTIKACIHF